MLVIFTQGGGCHSSLMEGSKHGGKLQNAQFLSSKSQRERYPEGTGGVTVKMRGSGVRGAGAWRGSCGENSHFLLR